MNTPLKLAGFGAVLAVVFTASFGVGRAVGPVGQTDPARHGPAEHTVPNPDAPTTTVPAHSPGVHGDD